MGFSQPTLICRVFHFLSQPRAIAWLVLLCWTGLSGMTPSYVERKSELVLAEIKTVQVLFAEQKDNQNALTAIFHLVNQEWFMLHKLPEEVDLYRANLDADGGLTLISFGQQVGMDWLSKAEWFWLSPQDQTLFLARKQGMEMIGVALELDPVSGSRLSVSKTQRPYQQFSSGSLKYLRDFALLERRKKSKELDRVVEGNSKTVSVVSNEGIPELPPGYDGQGPEYESSYYGKKVKLNNLPHEFLEFEKHGDNIGLINDDQMHAVLVEKIDDTHFFIEYEHLFLPCIVHEKTFISEFKRTKRGKGPLERFVINNKTASKSLQTLDFVTLTFAKKVKRKEGFENWAKDEDGFYIVNSVVIHERID